MICWPVKRSAELSQHADPDSPSDGNHYGTAPAPDQAQRTLAIASLLCAIVFWVALVTMAAGPFRWLLREWPTMVAMAIWAVGGTVMSVATLLTPPTWWLSRLAMVLNGAIWVVLILAGTFAGVLMIYFVIRVMFL